MTTEQQSGFDEWAIVEVMGHQRFGGRVTEQTIAGASFLRVDIPSVGDGRQTIVGFTKFFSASSIYAITPTTEELARGVAASVGHVPISQYDLPEDLREKLRRIAERPAIAAAVDDHDYDDEDDCDDEPF